MLMTHVMMKFDLALGLATSFKNFLTHFWLFRDHELKIVDLSLLGLKQRKLVLFV